MPKKNSRQRQRMVLFDETGLNKDHINSLKLVIWALAFGTVCFNVTGGVAMTGYLKQLGASDFVFGMISAIGPVASTLQIFASYLLERTKKRKHMFIISGLLQRTAWLPFGLVPFFVPMTAVTARIWTASFFMLITALTAPFMNVSFFSLLADLVPMRIRGRYLGVRQRVATIIGILGGLFTAWLLDKFPGFNGYSLVFAFAAVFGTIDVILFFAVKFPPMPETSKTDSISQMLSEVLKDKRFLKIIAAATFWAFAINLSNPFYFVYAKTILMLQNTTVALIMQIVPNICAVFMLPWWGRALDGYGNKPVMIISARLSSLAPLLWFFAVPGSFSVILMIVISMSAGLLSAGMDLGVQNAFLSQSPSKNRSMYVAMYSCLTALIGIGLANTMGGWLLDNVLSSVESLNLSPFGLMFNRYNYLFLLTFLLRILVAFILLPRMITEENAVSPGVALKEEMQALRRKSRLIKLGIRRLISRLFPYCWVIAFMLLY